MIVVLHRLASDRVLALELEQKHCRVLESHSVIETDLSINDRSNLSMTLL